MYEHIATDPGYGGIKIFGKRGALMLSSLVASGGRELVHSVGLRNRRPPLEITIGDRAFYVGPNAHDWGRPVENLDLDRPDDPVLATARGLYRFALMQANRKKS